MTALEQGFVWNFRESIKENANDSESDFRAFSGSRGRANAVHPLPLLSEEARPRSRKDSKIFWFGAGDQCDWSSRRIERR